jgi:hypothetical protein
MIVKAVYTHKGWFGPCPVYLGALTTECPNVMARHPAFDWLFDVVATFCDGVDWLLGKINPNGDGLQIGFLVTGELDEQLVINHEVEEA